MKRIVVMGVSMLTLVPASLGVVDNASFAQSVPVRVPPQAMVLNDKGALIPYARHSHATTNSDPRTAPRPSYYTPDPSTTVAVGRPSTTAKPSQKTPDPSTTATTAMTDAATALGDPSTDASLSDNPPDQSTIGDPSSAAISDPSTAATAAGATPCTPDPGTSDTGADSSTADEPSDNAPDPSTTESSSDESSSDESSSDESSSDESSDNAPDPSTTALPCGMTSGPGTTDTTDHAAADARHHHSKTDHGGTDPTGDQSAATDPSDNKPDPGTDTKGDQSAATDPSDNEPDPSTDTTGHPSAAIDPSDNKPDPGTEADREKSDPKTAAKSSDSKVNDSGSVKDDNPVDTRP